MGLSKDQPSETHHLWMIFPFKPRLIGGLSIATFDYPRLTGNVTGYHRDKITNHIIRVHPGSSYLREGRGLSTFLLDVSKNPWRITCLCQIILGLYIYIYTHPIYGKWQVECGKTILVGLG
jgi:hypothetical protein